MVTVLKTESGTQILSANLQKTIQSIREIVGNHSDSEIYNALKESNMDPNETAQKLLNQDPFHEVRRRRDKKKENAVYNHYVEPRKCAEYVAHGAKFYISDRNARRGGYTRRAVSGINREFRVVRDNRVNQNSDREVKASPHVSSSRAVYQSNVSDRSLSVPLNDQRDLGGRYIQSQKRVTDFRPKLARDINRNISKENLDQRRSAVRSSRSQVSMMKSTDSQNSASSNTVGVYASASDPVRVPLPDARSSVAIAAIRREVGVVGSRRQSSEATSKLSFQQSTSNLNSTVGSSSKKESFRPMDTVSRSNDPHASVVESAMIGSASSRLGNHFNNRLHQQTVGHQKSLLPSKEWKPKTSLKPTVPSPGVIGSPVKSVSKTADDSENVDREADLLENKLSQVNIHESQNVIIAEHIRVPDNDCFRLTFGSFALESNGANDLASAFESPETAEEASLEAFPSNKQINSVDDQVPGSGCSTPPSSEAAEDQSCEERDSSVVPNTEDYPDIGLVHNSPSSSASKSQQHQDPTDLPNFSAYDPQPVYDIPYFRPPVDDTLRESGLPSQEALSSHTAKSILVSSEAIMQQQVPMAQMYPQLHVSHFANVMPYRQFLPPLYVPPVVPGYSGNPGYPHLSNGSNYVLMPGASPHLTASNLKYGVQQFKPLPAGSPAGFCNFANPTAYAINAPGVVGGPVGVDDSSRMKYKDSNLYAPNPPAETSEIWIHSQREISGIQSTPYFNIQQQAAGHPTYLQSHPGHASFNAAAVAQQSSHMQFPGMYPPQPNVMPNGHHNMGVGVGPAAAGAQVGAFLQTQISHLNWTANF